MISTSSPKIMPQEAFGSVIYWGVYFQGMENERVQGSRVSEDTPGTSRSFPRSSRVLWTSGHLQRGCMNPAYLEVTHGIGGGGTDNLITGPFLSLGSSGPSLLGEVLPCPCLWLGSAESEQQLGRSEPTCAQSSEGKGAGRSCTRASGGWRCRSRAL